MHTISSLSLSTMQCLQCLVSDSIEMEETGVGDVPLEALAAQEQLADSWRALLIVAAHQHVS